MATRRRKGSGALRHLGDDRYRYQIEAPDGKTLSRVFTAKNATEAETMTGALRLELLEQHERKRLEKLEEDARKKDAAGAERQLRQTWTVERYTQFYMETWAPYHLADTTRARRASIFKHNVNPYIGNMRMVDVTPADLTVMYAALGSPNARQRGAEDAPLSGSTISTVHNHVRALFAFAVEEQKDFTTNPAATKAARPKVDKDPPPKKALSIAEVEAFVKLASEKCPRIAVPVMLSAYLGTRRGETVGLKWADVDFSTGKITVRRSVSRTVANGVHVKGTKTGKQRTIPLDSHTLAELKRIQREQRARRLKYGKGWRGGRTPDEDYIAAEEEGEGMRPDVFSNSFRTLCEQEKVHGITPHLLRHAWVSQMIALGFDPVTIASMAGHSPDVLLKTYAHAFDTRQREAIEAMGEQRKVARAL